VIEILFSRSTDQHYWVPIGRELLKYLLDYADKTIMVRTKGVTPGPEGLILVGRKFYLSDLLRDWDLVILHPTVEKHGLGREVVSLK